MNKIFFISVFLCGLGANAQPQTETNKRFEYAVFTNGGDSLNYRILWPNNYDARKVYPLVLFLHGAGERGSDNKAQLTHGAGMFADSIVQYPAIVVFPQCPKDDYWPVANIEQTDSGRTFSFPQMPKMNKSLELVSLLLDWLIKEHAVDTTRIYIGGLSMGAMGTYELVSKRPELFAAAIAICGGGNEDAASSYAKHTAFWIFHGTADDVVPATHSIAMEKALKEAGGNPKITLYKNVNHNSWDSAFAEPTLLSWLFSNSK